MPAMSVTVARVPAADVLVEGTGLVNMYFMVVTELVSQLLMSPLNAEPPVSLNKEDMSVTPVVHDRGLLISH